MLAYNSTIQIKLKPCKSCGEMCRIWSKGRCEQCAKVEDSQKRNTAANQDDGTKELWDKLDVVFSRYIRMKYAGDNGIAQCFTCDFRTHWTLLQCGHFISRTWLFLRADERNARPQCEHCNCNLQGNLKAFALNLEAEKSGIVEILREEKNTVHRHDKDELYSLINQYKTAIKYLHIGK